MPYPPSVNRYWRNVRGRTLISVEGRRYRTAALSAVQLARIEGKVQAAPFQKELRIEIEAIMPDRRKRDLDNLLKATLDGLTAAGVWQDDSQVVDLRIHKVGIGQGGLLVRIDSIDE